MLKLEKLSSLRLFGQLENTFHVRLLPRNLTDLTLSASKLSVDPMPELQRMLKLKSLCFYADSYTEEKMVCASGGFQQLERLRFWNLKNLKELDVIEGAMPKLQEFEVRSCKKLKVPTGLEHLKTIRIIKLRTMLIGFGKETQSLVDEKMPLVIVECDEMITNQGSQPSQKAGGIIGDGVAVLVN
ncbi:disease resistance RPP8-like protein [Trifolium medium]|uniref:Disease resistance RPP8-like protein n=1 Tax=Trifolium medium TaxID=97028 RepID=A0A392N1Y3_9FABA|nr:disease resistance RPP8-like protein [Trifolium medium]